MSQQEKKDGKVIIKGDRARAAILKGAKQAYDVVLTTYGAKGQNVLIEKTFGRPLASRDGVTVSREVYSSDRATNTGMQLVMEASETTNRIVGDGTSATVGLSYNLMKYGNQAIAAGLHPMEVKTILEKDMAILLEGLELLAKPVKKKQLQHVATVSSGDEILGQLIAETVEHVGESGGITVEKSYVQDIEREYIDGYYLQQGFTALQTGRKELLDPFVVVSSKRISSASDIIDILTGCARSNGVQPGQIMKMLFIGNFEEMAYNTIVENINKGTIDAVVIKTPPQFGEMGNQLLEDIAIYANCLPITESTNLRSFTVTLEDGTLSSPYVGTVDRVVANHTESTIFADNASEDVRNRIQDINDRLKDEISDTVSEKLRERISKLEGKVALFKIGGATDSEKEEKEFRVEDAIQATRAAQRKGVVAGGGVTLLELSKLDISEIYRRALKALFVKLLKNANLPSELKLEQVLQSPKGFGINLRGDDEPVDMIKEGIIDPALVVEQVIRNATSVANIALTTGVLLVFENKEV